MHIASPDGSQLEIALLGPGTAGTGDVVLSVRLSCSGFFGEAGAYIEHAELTGFVADLSEVLEFGRDKATLRSDCGRHSLTVSPLDRQGHFYVLADLSAPVDIRGRSFRAGCTGAFELEWSTLAALKDELAALQGDNG